MKRSALLLIVLLALACSGEPETAVEAETPATEPPATTPADQPATSDDTLDVIGGTRLVRTIAPEWETVEALTMEFYSGDLDALYDKFSADYKTEFSRRQLGELHDLMRAEYGEEIEVLASRKEEKQGYQAFFRASRFSSDERIIEVAFVLDANGAISGLAVTPDRSGATPR